MIIDSHQHYWQIARGDYGWLTPELAAIYRDFGPCDLKPLIAAAHVNATIAVQAAPSEAETVYLLALAANTPHIAGVVGWTAFDHPDAADHVAVMAADPLLVGMRAMIHDVRNDDWILSTPIERTLDAMSEARLVFDTLIRPRHLAQILVIAKRHPRLTIVIDHCAKPAITTGMLEPWASSMAMLAHHSNVVVKLSGLVTEASQDWIPADIAPYVRHVLRCFGPERILWGSDWPVLNLVGNYAGWMATTLELLANLTPDQRAAVMGGNARRIYLNGRGHNHC